MTIGATDFDIVTLRARRTNKWHKFPPDVLPAWVADMDFGVAPSITAALTRLTQNQEYGYAAREGVLAEAFVRRMQRRFGWHTDPANTLAVGDLVQASFSSVMPSASRRTRFCCSFPPIRHSCARSRTRAVA
jgi:cystathionine beta-lyase